MDEFDRNQAPEANEVPEYQVQKDNTVAPESNATDEYKTYDEFTDNEGKHFESGIKKEKKNTALSSLSVGVVSSIAAVAVGITSMLNVSMKANFNDVAYQDGMINYEVAVENMTEDESLYAKLYSMEDELLFETTLTDDDGDGIIQSWIEINSYDLETLLPQVGKLEYRLNLSADVGLDVERKFDSFVIEIESASSNFESVTGQCHCQEDGCFHFNLNFTDDLRIFDNFEAQIEDEYGNISKCTFTDNLHEEQTIFVNSLKGSKGTLTVNYTADGKPQTVSINISM